MATTRLFATLALLATATLTLTACDDPAPASTTPTSSASTVPSSSASTSPATHAPVTPKPTGSKGPTAHPSTPTTPVADCTANAQHPGHKVIGVVGATPGSTQLKASATKFVCGPDVPNDGYYEAVGAPAGYQLASGAVAELMAYGDKLGLRAVSVPDLVKHAADCAEKHDVARPFGCFGNMYDITVDSAGHITHISELYHP